MQVPKPGLVPGFFFVRACSRGGLSATGRASVHSSGTRSRSLILRASLPKLRHTSSPGFPMRRIVVSSLLAFCVIPAANALQNCAAGALSAPLASSQTNLSAVAPELFAHTNPLGAPSGVLAHAYDEAQSVDRVLLRMRVEACQNVAMAMPVQSVANPNDPAAYKPKTEFDNTPWRFDMTQNGKRMTADEFDAWMKSRGVRVVKGPPAVAAPAPVAAPVEPVNK